MKNKKWIIPVTLVVLLLVIPIPTGIARDGGTKTYTALTYKIVDWNRMYNDDDVYNKTKIYPLPMNFMSIDALFDQEEKQFKTTDDTAPENTGVDIDTYGRHTQYIRTSGYHEEIDYPKAVIIRSVDELKSYYEENKGLYYLERRTDISANNTIGFLDACDSYDEAYFENQILVLVLLQEPSGSNRHEVTNVCLNSKGKLEIKITTKVPEFGGTWDMALWHLFISPAAGVDVKDESDISVILDGVNTTDGSTVASYSKGNANLSINIPAGWEYEIDDPDDSKEFSILLWPAGHSDGKLKLQYLEAFGVCGTDLKQENITLGGYNASQGTYGNREVWEFIRFIDTPGSYVIMNSGINSWWDEYGDEAMKILETIKLGEGLLHKEDAVDVAKRKCTVKYDVAQANFQAQEEIWSVRFYQYNGVGEEQTITVDIFGDNVFVTDI